MNFMQILNLQKHSTMLTVNVSTLFYMLNEPYKRWLEWRILWGIILLNNASLYTENKLI